MVTPYPTGQHKSGFEITAEERELLWCVLRDSGARAMPGDTDAFVAEIQTAIGRYYQSKAEDPRRRSAREDLRDLFMACGDEQNIPKIRRRFAQLPLLAREELLRRAKARYRDLMGGADITWEGLCGWVQSCPNEVLLEQLPGMIVDGRALSHGQRRDNGNHSAPHTEPMIMGEFIRLVPVGEPMTRRKSAHKGGHPSDFAVDTLIADMAILWLEVTGNPPPSSRSDKKPFGRLVYWVLNKVGDVSPQNALRRYWASVKRHRSRASNIPVE